MLSLRLEDNPLKHFAIAVLIVISASLAIGQQANRNIKKLDSRSLAHAWASVGRGQLPVNTPSITGGGLVVESGVNGSGGRTVLLTMSQHGTYLFQGVRCDGDFEDLGGVDWQEGPLVPQTLTILDLLSKNRATPFAGSICSVDVVRYNGGRIERDSVSVADVFWQQSPPEFHVTNESISGSKYVVSISSVALSEDTIAILGQQLMTTEILRTPVGTTFIAFPDEYGPAGPSTLTICQKGTCRTITYQRQVFGSPSTGGGKG